MKRTLGWWCRRGAGQSPGAIHWNTRDHFFTAAAEAMRRILIDQARHKRKRIFQNFASMRGVICLPIPHCRWTRNAKDVAP